MGLTKHLIENFGHDKSWEEYGWVRLVGACGWKSDPVMLSAPSTALKFLFLPSLITEALVISDNHSISST